MDPGRHGAGNSSTNGAAYSSNEPVTASNGDKKANRDPDATDSDLLLKVQVTSGNAAHTTEPQRNLGNEYTPQPVSSVCRIKNELNEVVFWKFRLWMIIIFLFLLIIAVIMVSLALCTVIHEDEDEKFDPSLFKVPQYFNGSFQMPNAVFTEDFFTLSSNASQTLAGDLQQKLADLYRSSTALGRYFSKAEIYAFRNGSVLVDYELTFLLPEEELDQLRNFTLSREMVYNVFRQFLYDQETVESEPAYIDPVSLTMVSRN